MPARHVVVDGSNIATEGSSLPSLKQLDEAVREFLVENPDDVVTVVVDATFGHRIPPEERAYLRRGGKRRRHRVPAGGGDRDGVTLSCSGWPTRSGRSCCPTTRSRSSTGSTSGSSTRTVLSGANRSRAWVGFSPPDPGAWSPEPRVREGSQTEKADRAAGALDESGLELAAERSRSRGGERKLQRAIAVAVEEAVEPEKVGRKRRRRRRGGEVPSEPLNEPFNFITFIATNQLGAEVEGTVEEFSSHGAFISVGGARCYLPLSGMGDEPPRSAREVLRKGEVRSFVVQAFDAVRRGIELALPGFARPAGSRPPRRSMPRYTGRRPSPTRGQEERRGQESGGERCGADEASSLPQARCPGGASGTARACSGQEDGTGQGNDSGEEGRSHRQGGPGQEGRPDRERRSGDAEDAGQESGGGPAGSRG